MLYLNTDWGRTSKDIFAKGGEAGAQVVAAEGYQPTEKDFRSTLVRIGESKPDSIVLISYYADGAQIVRQARTSGTTLPIAAVGSVYSPKFLELGGTAVDGVYTESNFFPAEPRPEVQAFVQRYRAKFHADPDSFVARAYDALILSAEVLRRYGTTRGRARRLRENQRRAERDLRQGALRSADAPRRGRTHRVSGREAGAVGAVGRRETAARRALTPALNSMHVTDAS